MLLNERMLKWVMRLYPPLLFQRIWVERIHSDFKGVTVKLNHSFLNKNYNQSVFGGSIFSAADPFYPVLFHQYFTRKGYKVLVWLKSATVQYEKPVKKSVKFQILLSDDDLALVENDLLQVGKHLKQYPINIFDARGELLVAICAEIYIRNLNFK